MYKLCSIKLSFIHRSGSSLWVWVIHVRYVVSIKNGTDNFIPENAESATGDLHTRVNSHRLKF